jgi:2-dehydropantoate 2-reductase
MMPLITAPDQAPDSIGIVSPEPHVVVVGAGAVGGYFGGMLARAGVPVTMIGRPAFVSAVSHNGLYLETLTFAETVNVNAVNDMRDAQGADIVLFCVKATDTFAVTKELAPFVAPTTIILSLQNGVENVSQIRASTKATVLPAVVYLAASTPEPGHVKHEGRGDLIIGPIGVETARLQSLFEHAGIPCRMSDDIEGDIWEKFTCNCALNAISALSQKSYGEIGEHFGVWEIAEAVIQETLKIASAASIIPSNMRNLREATATVRRLTRQISGAYSSTAQDLRRSKRTEIDSLNGFIARRGRELGINVSINQMLFSLVKLAEVQNQ